MSILRLEIDGRFLLVFLLLLAVIVFRYVYLRRLTKSIQHLPVEELIKMFSKTKESDPVIGILKTYFRIKRSFLRIKLLLLIPFIGLLIIGPLLVSYLSHLIPVDESSSIIANTALPLFMAAFAGVLMLDTLSEVYLIAMGDALRRKGLL